MNKHSTLAFFIILSGCSTPNQSSFHTGSADYKKLAKNMPVIETRLFTKLSSDCTSVGTSQETLPALVVTGLGFLAKEGVAYGKQYLEKQAAYLNADVKLNAKAYLSFETTPSWPPKTLANDYQTDKEAKINEAGEHAENIYKTNNPDTMSDDKKLIASKNKAMTAAEKKYNDSANEIKASNNDLCLLAIAGEYKTGNTNNAKIKNDFIDFTGAKANRLAEYSMPLPGVDVADYPRPFDTLNTDPSFVIEMHLTPTPVGGKMLYTLRPTYIFYPHPLHKKSANGLERKLSIDVSLGANKIQLTFDALKSGSTYDNTDLVTKYTMLETAIDQSFQTLSIEITEGPDSMPTAKILTDIAAQDQAIQKYLLEKLDTISSTKENEIEKTTK